MSFLRLVSKFFGYSLLVLSVLSLVILLFYGQIIESFPTLYDSIPGNASSFLEEHPEEFRAYMQEISGDQNFCIEGDNNEACLIVENTSILTQQFSQLPLEFYTEQYFPPFKVAEQYKGYVILGMLVSIMFGLLFLFLGYRPDMLSFFRDLSFFFFFNFLILSIGAYFFLQLIPEDFLVLMDTLKIIELSDFLVLFVASIILPYLQSLVYDLLYFFFAISGSFLVLFLIMFTVQRKKNNELKNLNKD